MSAPGPSERRACRFRRASAAAGFVIFSAMGAFAATLLPPLSGAEVHGSNPLVVELKLDGEVEPILAAYIDEGLADAARRHASLVLLTMDTPGGLSDSMKDIIQHILASPVPVGVYVWPTGARGASAGFYILLSADIAAMAPGTHAGAASPIIAIGGFPQQIDEVFRRKINQDAMAFLRSFTVRRGRNPELAEKAITESKAFTEKECLDGKMIDLIVNTSDDLIRELDGRTITRFDGTKVTLALQSAVLEPFELSARQRFLARIVEPDVFFVLLILGVLGLYTEFTHPGVIALGGIVSMFLGAVFLIRSPLTAGGVSLGVALSATLPFGVLAVVLMKLVLRSRKWKTATGKEELIGCQGTVTAELKAGEEGMVRVHGELLRAESSQPVPERQTGRITKAEGLKLYLEPVEVATSAAH